MQFSALIVFLFVNLILLCKNYKPIKTHPIGASVDKTRSKLETTEQVEVLQFYSIQSIKNYFYLYNSDSLPEMRFHLTASFTGPR